MSNFKTTFSPLVLCLTLAIATPVMAKKGHYHQHDNMRKILSELSLTDTQKQDIRQILKQTREDKSLFNTDAKSLKIELHTLVQSAEWDQTAVQIAINQLQVFKQTKALQRAKNQNQVWNVLTDYQQAEFVAQLDTQKAKRERIGDNWKEKRNGKNLKHLNLTEDQLASVEAIKATAKINSEETKEKLQAYQIAERALIQSTEFNAEAWQTLNSGYQADFVTLAILKAKTQYEIWNILTSEQQSEAQEKYNKRSKGGKRHNRQQSV